MGTSVGPQGGLNIFWLFLYELASQMVQLVEQNNLRGHYKPIYEFIPKYECFPYLFICTYEMGPSVGPQGGLKILFKIFMWIGIKNGVVG